MNHPELPTYIPLSEAALRYAVPEKILFQAIEDEVIRAAEINKQVVVAAQDVSLLLLLDISIKPELCAKPIRVTEASRKYAVSQANLTRWADAGYIRILDRGPKLLVLDEGEVQRAVKIFDQAYQATGSSVRAGWVLKRTLNQLKNCS